MLKAQDTEDFINVIEFLIMKRNQIKKPIPTRLKFKCVLCGCTEYVGGPGTGAWLECANCGNI